LKYNEDLLEKHAPEHPIRKYNHHYILVNKPTLRYLEGAVFAWQVNILSILQDSNTPPMNRRIQVVYLWGQ
jgi:hypothetical protein